MANQWYAKVMGEEIGPMTSEQLKQMAVQNLLSPEDLIRKGESGNWTPANRFNRLFDGVAPALPPVPPPVAPAAPRSPIRTVRIEDVKVFVGDTESPYHVIGPISTKVGAMTALSKRPTIEEINFHLIEIAVAKGANAIINVEYKRGISMSSWKTLWATGTAVVLAADDRPCPTCAEMVKVLAMKCRFCGGDLPEIPRAAQPELMRPKSASPRTRSFLWAAIQYIFGCMLILLGGLEVAAGHGFGGFFMTALVGLVVTPYTWDHMYKWSGVNPEFARGSRWIALFVILFLGGIMTSATSNTRSSQATSYSSSQSDSIPKDDGWTNSSIDTRGMSEMQRIELFHKFIYIEDRNSGDKAAQRPYKQQLYDEYGIDEKFEIKLLGEAIDSKWLLPPE